ncbi:unnamed protein product [Polarella glacialis]|uniref:Uncharacterized protein n=1 Tax=Polarella glacialis TaxID=89957 RepID=A0A813JCQ8_POLGL|nr:unnamed protein product [Polarella glacialis]
MLLFLLLLLLLCLLVLLLLFLLVLLLSLLMLLLFEDFYHFILHAERLQGLARSLAQWLSCSSQVLCGCVVLVFAVAFYLFDCLRFVFTRKDKQQPQQQHPQQQQ